MDNNLSSDLKEAYFSSIKEFKDGDIVQGTIVEVRPKEVIVDIGYKSEGIVLADEFMPEGVPPTGTQIEVLIDAVEDEEGKLVISYQKAKKTLGWRTLSTKYNEGDIVEGVVVRKVKGGFMVDVFGTEGFLPGSLSAFRDFAENEIIAKKFLFQIVRLSKAKQNFIVSRKDALKAEKELRREKVWESLKVGEVVKGKVKSIADFGAFIDIGGIDGLLHIGDMSWRKINHPSEIVAVGNQVEVMILNIDKQSKRLSLGMKQLTQDPWNDIQERFPAGSVVKGKIVNIQNYGVFVELDKGIEGLVHISELSWSRLKESPQDMFAIGDMIEVKVINVDVRSRKISLSVKRLERDPWENLPESFATDVKVKGKVVGFIQDAAFVELPEGMEAIVYTKDLSWTKRINRPQEILKRNHIYEFKILDIDRDNRRIILGFKQLKDDPWSKILENYPVGKVLETEIVKITDFGVFVKLEEELEGLIFEDEIDKEVKDGLNVSDNIKAKIIKVDSDSRKIGLSAKIDEPEEENS
ncbi:MAG: S1 RNA-binding domain-containing protein [Candidatus Omnitrophica bacterium]|nr:S1 RNA-binding domain-containing protein [Candidatus Omnitrophota bacterium]